MFDEDYLDTFYRELKYEKEFYRQAYTSKVLDLESFHKAFDEDIKDLGLTNLFTADGKLIHKGTYGDIKKINDQKSPVALALKKLWAFQFVDNLPTKEEAEDKRRIIEKRIEHKLKKSAE